MALNGQSTVRGVDRLSRKQTCAVVLPWERNLQWSQKGSRGQRTYCLATTEEAPSDRGRGEARLSPLPPSTAKVVMPSLGRRRRSKFRRVNYSQRRQDVALCFNLLPLHRVVVVTLCKCWRKRDVLCNTQRGLLLQWMTTRDFISLTCHELKGTKSTLLPSTDVSRMYWNPPNVFFLNN